MWNLLVLIALAFPTLAFQAPKDGPPSAQTVQATVAKLETAFRSKKSAECAAAIREATPVLDARVIEWIAKGIEIDDAPLCATALDALGAMRHPDALAALQRAWKRDKELRKHDELGGRALKAIARHQDPQTIELLAADPFESKNHAALQARIFGLANIRSKQSVEKLVAMMRLVGPQKLEPYMPDFRLALFVLTGHDEGRAAQLWFDWWNDHQKDFEVSKELPELPKLDRARWNSYWGIEDESQRERGPKSGPKRDKDRRGDREKGN
ncbi:MAG: HEAT repeat domain-containing protein [Planctomycetes bacterium]|nr:HEAT repeat domain-containing protein [Planctomycetota bacterium]